MVVSERYGTTVITVTIEWTQTRDDVWYDVSTEPLVDVKFVGNTSVQLVVFYNTLYNMTIVVHSLVTLLTLQLDSITVSLICGSF